MPTSAPQQVEDALRENTKTQKTVRGGLLYHNLLHSSDNVCSLSPPQQDHVLLSLFPFAPELMLEKQGENK